MTTSPALMLIGHGSRDSAGVDEYWQFTKVLQNESPSTQMGFGFIEMVEPDLDTAIDALVADGAREIQAVPLVLLGAGHMKNDGPAALARARERHPGVELGYGNALGIHPTMLEVAEERIREAVERLGSDPAETAVVLVGRGSFDPDANSDLYKIGRLLADSRGLGEVTPGFVSLAPPSVPEALERVKLLGFNDVVVVPYFLFTGVLVERIAAQAREWAEANPTVRVLDGRHLGPDPRIARLVLERHAEAAAGGVAMNCDCCVYRVGLPGYESKVGAPIVSHHDREHGHSHDGHSHSHATHSHDSHTHTHDHG